MTDQQLAEINARNEAMMQGNQGKWRAEFESGDLVIWFHADFERDPIRIIMSYDDPPSKNEKACAEFIVNAPQDIATLLAELGRQVQEIKTLRGDLNFRNELYSRLKENNEQTGELWKSQCKEIEELKQQLKAHQEVITGLRTTPHEAGWPTREREYKRQLDGQHDQIMNQAEMIANLKLEMDALRQNYDQVCQDRDRLDKENSKIMSWIGDNEHEIRALQSDLLKASQERDLKSLALQDAKANIAGLTNELKRKDYAAQELQTTISQQKELLDQFVASQEHLTAERDHLRQVAEVAERHKRVLVAAIEFHQQVTEIKWPNGKADKELYRILEQVTGEGKDHANTND